MIHNVTEDHIKRGVRGEFQSCPVYLCLAENHELDGLGLWVGNGYVKAWSRQVAPMENPELPLDEYGWFCPDKPEGISIPLPEKVSEFIRAYDNGLPTSPFSFELDILDYFGLR